MQINNSPIFDVILLFEKDEKRQIFFFILMFSLQSVVMYKRVEVLNIRSILTTMKSFAMCNILFS